MFLVTNENMGLCLFISLLVCIRRDEKQFAKVRVKKRAFVVTWTQNHWIKMYFMCENFRIIILVIELFSQQNNVLIVVNFVFHKYYLFIASYTWTIIYCCWGLTFLRFSQILNFIFLYFNLGLADQLFTVCFGTKMISLVNDIATIVAAIQYILQIRSYRLN